MVTRKYHGGVRAVQVGALLYMAGSVFSVGYAYEGGGATGHNITSSGLATVVNQPGAGVYEITGGTRPGSGTNLFHSFGNFSLDAGQSGNFINDSGLSTTNIIGRVTGGNPSNIFGTIQTTGFPGANLYLMNPAGILFGPTAQLNVEGSFHATTADYIKLGSDGIFYADAASSSVLTMSSPSAFGFLSSNPGSIEVQAGGIDFDTFLPAALLQVPEGETLSLVGGTINVGTPDSSTSGYLLAPAGTVNLVSVASPGEVTLDDGLINADGFAQLGNINITGGSLVDAKNIVIRGGNLAIDQSVLVPGAFAFELSFVGYSPLPDGGEVNIKVRDNLTITGTGPELLTFTPPGIFVYTGDPLGNSITPDAKVPDVNIDAGSVSISGFAGIQVQRNAPGETGNVTINADTITVGSGGSIVLINGYAGDGPSLTVNARELDVSGDGSDSPFGFEGIAVQGIRNVGYPFAGTDPELLTANSGSITINASDSLNVTGLGQVTTDSRTFGTAGDIAINAGNITVAGTGNAQSAVIGSQSFFAGDSGDITINATGAITVKDGARITSTSLGSGDAGNITLTAAGPITLSGADARIVGATYQPPDSQLNDFFNEVFYEDFDSIRTEMGNPSASLMEVLAYMRDVRGVVSIPDLDLTPGDAGTVSVTTPVLTLNTGTRIETSTGWEGNAGGVNANVGSLFLNGGAIRSRSGVEFLDGTTGVGPGNAGTIDVSATDTISISGAGSAITTTTLGDGNGGDISLSANRVNISDGGSVSADSLGGTGLTGNITISAGDEITMNDGSISTRAITSDGGNIELIAPNIIRLTDSQISTTVESGVGGGGNIAIDPDFVVLNNSSITANAFGGPGGNILIVAGNFLQSADSTVEASSAQNVQGTVRVQSPDNNIAGSIAQLAQNYVDSSTLLPAPCVARRSGAQSTFVVAGRGGVPAGPDNYLPSFPTSGALPVDAGAVAALKFDAGLRQDEQYALAGTNWECAP